MKAVLVHFEKTGNALVGSTFARNVCTATSHSVDVPTVGAIGHCADRAVKKALGVLLLQAALRLQPPIEQASTC